MSYTNPKHNKNRISNPKILKFPPKKTTKSTPEITKPTSKITALEQQILHPEPKHYTNKKHNPKSKQQVKREFKTKINQTPISKTQKYINQNQKKTPSNTQTVANKQTIHSNLI